MLYPLRETNPHNSVKGRRRRGLRQIKRESFPVTGSANSGDRRGRYTGSASGLLAYFANITHSTQARDFAPHSSLCCSVHVFTTSDFTNDSFLQCSTFFCYLTSLYSWWCQTHFVCMQWWKLTYSNTVLMNNFEVFELDMAWAFLSYATTPVHLLECSLRVRKHMISCKTYHLFIIIYL